MRRVKWIADFRLLCAPAGYFYEGFLVIQRAVDLQITHELGGAPAKAKLKNTDVHLKRFPYLGNYDEFTKKLKGISGLALAILFSIFLTATQIFRDVVQEKEHKLKVWLIVAINLSVM